MRGLTLKELQDIKQSGQIHEDWPDNWKDLFIRSFANMESSIYSTSDAVNYVIGKIQGASQ